MNSLSILALQAPCVIFATTLHEFTRAFVSTKLGDNRPRDNGRLTLNPFKHFEPIGFLLALLTGFGWGLPVETSSLYYKDRKKGTLLTAVLPTVSNLVAAAVFGILIKAVDVDNYYIYILLLGLISKNVAIAVYNIVPITPMDCLKVLSVAMPANSYFKYIQYEKIIQMVFLLALFMGYTNIIFAPIINIITNLLT